MIKPRVFIGSSTTNLKVARAIRDGLVDFATVTVWDQGVFRLNDSFLPRLVEVSGQYDCAVMVWAPDDVTDSKGEFQASPRDNVIFESGLFMGALGLDHVFVVLDSDVITKVPTDFAGITVARYDGTRMDKEPGAAVHSACDAIKVVISTVPCKHILGEWCERYVEFVDRTPSRCRANIEVAAFASTVALTAYDKSGKEVLFEARGRLDGNRIRGEWQETGYIDKGPFLLVLDHESDLMFGYRVGYDADGGTLFQAWILAKWETKDGRRDQDTIIKKLKEGEETLMKRTAGLGIAVLQ